MTIAAGETKLRVRYAETDKMGVVYHSNFVIWFEVGRVELLRQLGFQYSDMEQQDDCHIPVVDLRVRYKSPAQYDDVVVLRTEIKNVRSSLLHFSYEVFREADRKLLATGETTHIIVDKKLKRRALPEKYMKAFREQIKNS
ncbi:MAG TPA: thioesterase family protein [Candidatus Angelobacter sp.]|jgi:acyl-CoA thioester hydrolase